MRAPPVNPYEPSNPTTTPRCHSSIRVSCNRCLEKLLQDLAALRRDLSQILGPTLTIIPFQLIVQLSKTIGPIKVEVVSVPHRLFLLIRSSRVPHTNADRAPGISTIWIGCCFQPFSSL